MTKLDIVETVLSSFHRVASKATFGVVGLGLLALSVVIGGLLVAEALASMSVFVAGLIGLAAFAIYLALVASLTVGAFRAFDQKEINQEMFRENILWPFLRMMGSNIVIQAFLFSVIYILVYPMILLGSLTGLGGTGLLTGMNMVLIIVGGLVGLIGVVAMLYIMAALTLSMPRIAVDDKRLFQALDESVQTTKGNRLRIIATFIPFAAFMAGAVAGAALGGIPGLALYFIFGVLASLYMVAALTELNSQLK